MDLAMTTSKSFHGAADAELYFARQRSIVIRWHKRIVVQERNINYRFALHQHPYVSRLVDKLLSGGVPALQVVDTEYAPGGATVPGSVELATDADVSLPLPLRTPFTLSSAVQATAPGGAIELTPGLRLLLFDPVALPVHAGATVVLLDSVPAPSAIGTGFTLPGDTACLLAAGTPTRMDTGTAVLLPNGQPASLSGEADVILAADTQATIPAGTRGRLLSRRWLPKELYGDIFSATSYAPSPDLVQRPYPVKDLDFGTSGAYGVYNWELFFHVPITIAIHLSKNQRFAEAQRWFHYIFDPTDDSDGPTPERFWKVRPFQYTDVTKVEQILVNLATGTDPTLRDETLRGIEAWKDTPFRPHVIARYRQQAYMYKTVMAYLDNLIAWGDSLFRQDTGEAIDEALMLYVLAADILGPRPLPVPTKGTVRPQTYANLRDDLQQFGTVMRDVEADVPFDLAPFPTDTTGDEAGLATVRSLGKALYFCVPRNDKLLGYWDTVADRLFKIRNSLNIAGTFRRLALFEPPIDPALLARAAAGGLDVGAIVNGLNQPLPLVRFQLLVQKAAELAQEVKTLGGNLLSAMEKEDGEALAILRARHERVLLELGEQVKYGQLQEAIKAREGLVQSLASAVQRYTYYERQLGRKPADIAQAIPTLDDLDAESLAKLRLVAQEPVMALRDIDVDIATDLLGQAASALYGGKLLSSHEVRESLLLEAGQFASDVANVLGVAGSIAHLIPQAKVHVQPWGLGGTVEYGGRNIGDGLVAGSSAARAIADRVNFEARRAARIDSFARREREWAYQSNLAAGEITQIFKQLRAAQIREAVAGTELSNHRKQIEQARVLERFLNEDGSDPTGKRTSKTLYTWMKREARGLYGECFQLAFDVARRAERALQHELGDPSQTFLKLGYLAGNEGLLAGEKLHLDVKRMEVAYQELNRREYELTKHVSLLQVDPLALVQLRATGRCTMRVPETVFDLDTPGHYFRRIKNVAVSVPCVTGPYAGVNLTLTLLKSSIRVTPVPGDQYGRTGSEDPRFDDYYGSSQSIVASSGQNDSGLFDASLRDERYLPFEYAGVISEWQLELPANPGRHDPQQFDYDTITDVIMHIRYTARAGGEPLRQAALTEVSNRIKDATMSGCVRLFSLRHEFPSEWAAFQGAPASGDQRHKLSLALRPEHYPFWAQRRLTNVHRVDLLARSGQAQPPATLVVFDRGHDEPGTPTLQDALPGDPTKGGLFAGALAKIPLPQSPVTPLTLYLEDADLDDMWIGVTWAG
jgi:hypothetical protein